MCKTIRKIQLFDSETFILVKPYQQNRIYKTKNYDFTTYRSLYEPKFTEKGSLEQLLFEFSNRIRAFVTYLLIYCRNPDNYQDSLTSDGNDEYMNRSFEYVWNMPIIEYETICNQTEKFKIR